MNKRVPAISDRHAARRGFTLVEMLVSTALVVLIMLLFAQIYSTALGTITSQRGIGANDQKARVNVNLIRADLENRTFRQVGPAFGTVRGLAPLGAGDDSFMDPLKQRGYFAISENEPGVDWDDVLTFTTMIEVSDRKEFIGTPDDRAYVGKAVNLNLGNEPELDDGYAGNTRGRSRAAEVCYFLRGGNLYRRVLLLRDPLPANPPADKQPTTNLNVRYFGPTNRNYVSPVFTTNSYYQDFDYAATRMFDDPTNSYGTGYTSYLWFHSIDSLNNAQGLASAPLAAPWNRFGHLNDQRDFVVNSNGTSGGDGIPDNLNHGMPREYLNGTGAAPPSDYFLGRFTQWETSSNNAIVPGVEAANSYLFFNRTNTASFNYNTDFDVVQQLSDGMRTGEDIILTNVEAFDIKVWEPNYFVYANGQASGAFVDLGHAWSGSNPFAPVVYFDHQGNQNKLYGPRFANWGPDGGYGAAGADDDGIFGADNSVTGFNYPTYPSSELGWPGSDDTINRIFDTWHPGIPVYSGYNPIDITTGTIYRPYGTGLPPYRPLQAPPSDVTGSARGTQWAPTWTYGIGNSTSGIVHYPLAGWDQNNNGNLDPAETTMTGDVNGNGMFDPAEQASDIPNYLNPSGVRNFAIGYRVVRSGVSGAKRPDFVLVPGTLITESGYDADGDGTIDLTDPNERGVIWECFDNRVGLKAIQIILRFNDVQTELPRQVTIEHSFVE